MSSPHDVVVGVIADGVVQLVRRLCSCERMRREYARDLELAEVADQVTRALADGRAGSYGPVEVEVRRRALGLSREVKVRLWGREVDVDQLLAEISRARSRLAWLQADCSDASLMEALYASDDRYAIEFVQRNLTAFSALCRGEPPSLDLSGLPAHVAEGISRGVEAALAEHAKGGP